MGGTTTKLKRWVTGSDEEAEEVDRTIKRFASAKSFVFARRGLVQLF